MSQPTQWGQQSAGPAPMTAISVRANASFDALLNMHIGSDRPSYAVAGTQWLDNAGVTIGTLSGVFIKKLYDGADDIPVGYIDPTGNAMWTDPSPPEVEIASASLTDLATLKSTRGILTGDADINSFGTAPNKIWTLRATGAPKIKHNSSNIICPGDTDYEVTAGTILVVGSGSDGVSRLIGGMKADGTALVGSTDSGGGGGSGGTRAYPIGALFYWPATTPPAGALERDGSAVSRTTYAALFTLIGTTYGEGDGSTTFNLPDDRGLFERGWDNGRGYDTSRVFGSEQNYGQRAQTGTFYAYVPSGPYGTSGNFSQGGASGMGNVGSGTHGVNRAYYSLNASGITVATEVRPRNRAYLPCIQAL